MLKKELEIELMNANKKIRKLNEQVKELKLFIANNTAGDNTDKINILKAQELIQELQIKNKQLEKENKQLKERTIKKITKPNIRHTKKYKEFRKKILKRDKYKCTNCGSDKKLQIHHIKSIRQISRISFRGKQCNNFVR